MDSPTRPQLRDVGDDAIGAPFIAPVGDRWAVVVGISRYQASELDLLYARRDAEELSALLQTPEGGNFHPHRVRLLLDAAATTLGITKALRSFLLEAMPDDLVLLYFACHGGPDQRRPTGPLYLYSYDTDPADVAGTAVPMDDLDRSLRQVRAERVVITVDTCHSGGIGAGIRAAGRAEATNRYLDALARARGGVALLSSAEASESSEEDAKWGGGHGVFTHFLLEGMRGAADGYQGKRDGIVSVGELFEYVRHQVRTATEGRQHPAIGTTAFDRALPMAVTAELDVEQHLTLARRLYDVGWQLDDPAPFLLAARQFAIAADLKRHLPAADAERGSSLLAAGRTDEAVRVLQTTTTMSPEEVPTDAWLHLGIAKAELNEPEAAARAFREYVRRDPDADESTWATAYADWLDRHHRPRRRRILLVGVGHYEGTLAPLPGVAGDLTLMRQALHAADAAAIDIQTLHDSDATRDSVLAAIAAIGAEADQDDVVVLYFTGHSVDTATLDEPYLITGAQDQKPVGITARELIDALDLPVQEVLLILDTHVTPALMQYAADATHGRLQILLASGVGDVAYEVAFDDGQMHGVFTYHLAEVLAAGGATSYGELLDAVGTRMAAALANRTIHLPQRPRLIGARSARVLAGRFFAADLWRTARRRTCRPGEIARLRRDCAEVTAPLAMWTLGRALVDAKQIEEGWQWLTQARDGLHSPPTELWLDLVATALDRGDRAGAVKALRALSATENGYGPVHATLDAVIGPDRRRPVVMVIGADPDTRPVGGAESATRIAEALTGALGLRETDLQLITGPAATRERILAEAAGHARQSTDRLVIFVLTGAISTLGLFFGAGAAPHAHSDVPALYTRDGPLPLDDVFAELIDAVNVLTLLDVVATSTRIPRDVAKQSPPSIDPATVVAGVLVLIVEAAANAAGTGGIVTGDAMATLLTTLPAAARDDHTYQQWIDLNTPQYDSDGSRPEPPWYFVLGDQVNRTALTDLSPLIAIRRSIADTRTAGAAAAERHAQAEIDRRAAAMQPYPEGHLQRGLALEVCGRLPEARAALRTARNLYEDTAIWAVEQQRDLAAALECRRQTRYHYGRLLLADNDRLEEAVSVLRDALQPDGDDPRILQTLAQAIQTVIERRSLVEAADYIARYVNQGAPFGLDAKFIDALIQRQHARFQSR